MNMNLLCRMNRKKNQEVVMLRKTGVLSLRSKKGMELVQVGILIAIAVGIGLIFKEQIGIFVNNTFSTLLGSSFS